MLIAFGCIGFVLCILSEPIQKKLLFFAGFIFIAVSTVVLALTRSHEFLISVPLQILFAIFAVLFFALLIYSLFFALPKAEAYKNMSPGSKAVCDKGVYALCRHPAVIWFAAFYLFFALFLASYTLLWAALFFSLMNLIYIILQDMIFFPKEFKNYDLYKKKTPFLIPTKSSIALCFKTLRRKEGIA